MIVGGMPTVNIRRRAALLAGNGPGCEHGPMRIVSGTIAVTDLQTMADGSFGDLVKAVVDVRRSVLAVDAGMHSDLEASLLDDGSLQGDLWGIDRYPAEFGTPGFLEFDPMINLRPAHGNRTRSVDDPVTRDAIEALIRQMGSA